MEQVGKLLVILGILLALAGIVLIVFPKIPFLGKLPGDITIEKENFKVYIPLGTSILLSLLLSALLWFIHYIGRK
ncbi:MAG: DUF2905 domain-containing protein [Bacteroidetes bacterium]|nr:DUF2905 domain-containing protein [Bacteroidota bacterium]